MNCEDQDFYIKNISFDSVSADMLLKFHHYQIIDQKYININGRWEISKVQELREWSTEKRIWIAKYLREQIGRGGSLAGAFAREA